MCNENISPREFSVFKDLDNLFKCGICYEYMKTCVITSCSHNYCSYCIRKSLTYKTQCPTCFEETTESQLRNNRVLDEIIRIFTLIRGKILKCFTNAEGLYVSKNVLQNDGCSSVENDGRASGSSFNNISYPSSSSPQKNIPSRNEHDAPKKEILIPSMFSPRKNKGNRTDVLKVPCPVCSVDIPEININIHLDACLRRIEESKCERNAENEKRKPLPKLVYTLIQDKMLRKKLSDLGLSTTGDRKSLVNRHKRYTLLYNSECDSSNPRPVAEIIKQLEKEEQEERKASVHPAPVTRLVVDRNADPRDIQEAQRQYLQDHRSSFKNLIEQIKKRSNIDSDKNTIRDSDKEVVVVEESSTSSEEIAPLQRTRNRSHRRISSEGEDEVEVAAHIDLCSSSPHIVSDTSSGTSVDDLTLLHDALDRESREGGEGDAPAGKEEQGAEGAGPGSRESSPVLGMRAMRGRQREAMGKAKVEQREWSESPDIFHEMLPSQCSPTLPADQLEEKCKEEESDDSISLMIHHESEASSCPALGSEALEPTSSDQRIDGTVSPEDLLPSRLRRSSRRRRDSSPSTPPCTSPRVLRKRAKKR